MTKPTPKPIRPKKHKAFPACGTESKVRRGKAKDGELRKRSPKPESLVDVVTIEDIVKRLSDYPCEVRIPDIKALLADWKSLKEEVKMREDETWQAYAEISDYEDLCNSLKGKLDALGCVVEKMRACILFMSTGQVLDMRDGKAISELSQKTKAMVALALSTPELKDAKLNEGEKLGGDQER